MPRRPAAPAILPARQALRIVTWNINSVRLRRPLLAELVRHLDPHVICLQETKCPDEHFPLEEIRAFGFPHVAHRGMKGYNGVAVLSRLPFAIRHDDPNWCAKNDCRHLGVELDVPGGPLELHDFYVPAGGDEPDPAANPKFAHKLDFLAEATAWMLGRGPARRSVMLGDLNVAPLEHDVWSHKALLKVVSHTPVEVAAMAAWMAAGQWHDAVRHFVPAEEKLYSWWSYRAKDWEAADRGRRLDHVWCSQDLAGALTRQHILKPARGWPQASDHVPVLVELAL
ncbi:exodeoxyribonuclease III [Paeniroseomonas aquatica]|uniref:Exodeoxyribonuclease III n=1 Tax=Paeniroseomonas aquatica TaxID=373043 RepID=A0ABT8AFN7_9PROT|nr:exodeoxyribonuclease III [Paeniroseomonas aquatica]MDN3568572.1 exodeoxyribonuclease III [Paeniroseomonas aquatica]